MQGAATSVAAPAQRGVVTFARQVTDNCYPRTVIERMAKAAIARVAHQDHALLAALFGDGRDTRVATQSTIISFGKSGARFRDYSSRYDSTDSRQRTECVDLLLLRSNLFILSLGLHREDSDLVGLSLILLRLPLHLVEQQRGKQLVAHPLDTRSTLPSSPCVTSSG